MCAAGAAHLCRHNQTGRGWLLLLPLRPLQPMGMQRLHGLLLLPALQTVQARCGDESGGGVDRAWSAREWCREGWQQQRRTAEAFVKNWGGAWNVKAVQQSLPLLEKAQPTESSKAWRHGDTPEQQRLAQQRQRRRLECQRLGRQDPSARRNSGDRVGSRAK